MPELQSKHFKIQTLAEGVWAAIALEGGAAIGNCGIVNLGYQTALFDTTLTTQAAFDLRVAAEELNGRPAAWVVNSHYHNDHCWGNLVFGDAPTVCSAQTRQLMSTDGQEEYQWNLAHAAAELAALQQQAQSASDEPAPDLNLWLGYYQGLVEDLPRLILRLPDLTFDQRATLHGDMRTAELLTFAGHTGSDTVLYLPQDGIVFAGDLLFVGFHPYLGDGDPLRLLDALRQINAWGANAILPGHGPVGSAEDIRLLSEYVQYCLETAGTLVAERRAEDYATAIDNLPIPEAYRAWRMTRFFRANLRSFCQRMVSSQSRNT